MRGLENLRTVKFCDLEPGSIAIVRSTGRLLLALATRYDSADLAGRNLPFVIAEFGKAGARPVPSPPVLYAYGEWGGNPALDVTKRVRIESKLAGQMLTNADPMQGSLLATDSGLCLLGEAVRQGQPGPTVTINIETGIITPGPPTPPFYAMYQWEIALEFRGEWVPWLEFHAGTAAR